MTREEAIDVLEKMKYPQKVNKNGFVISNVDIENEALDMAIQALSQEPTDTWSIKEVADTFKKHGLIREQEPCDDAIGRAEAMTEIMMFAGNVKPDEEDIYIKVSDAVQLLRELPSVSTTKNIVNHGTMNITL